MGAALSQISQTLNNIQADITSVTDDEALIGELQRDIVDFDTYARQGDTDAALANMFYIFATLTKNERTVRATGKLIGTILYTAGQQIQHQLYKALLTAGAYAIYYTYKIAADDPTYRRIISDVYKAYGYYFATKRTSKLDTALNEYRKYSLVLSKDPAYRGEVTQAIYCTTTALGKSMLKSKGGFSFDLKNIPILGKSMEQCDEPFT